MIKRSDYRQAQRRAATMIREAGIHLTEAEADRIDAVDFGLSRLDVEGVQVFTMFATDRISAKVLVTFPHQTEPEHWHPPVGDDPGKEETIRVIAGTLIFFVPGTDTLREGWVPAGKEACYTARHEIVMKPGDQLTLPPGTKHWFQAREGGAVFYSFSTCVRDGLDRFSDPAVVRQTRIEED
jgi:D-lyxose ketol-isomerase